MGSRLSLLASSTTRPPEKRPGLDQRLDSAAWRGA